MKFIDAKTGKRVFPWNIKTIDAKEYIRGDYRYTYRKALRGWEVRVVDNTKSEYGPILKSIADKPIKSLGLAFCNCESLVRAPIIPERVVRLSGAFMNCISLQEAPVIPEDVEDMCFAFSGCKALLEAPDIPDSVVDMESTFARCNSLVDSPLIPNYVRNMAYAFSCCESLKIAPVIPAGVTNMEATFEHCIGLRGVVQIDADPQQYECCFRGVDFVKQGITLTGWSSMHNELGRTGKNYYKV